MLGESTEWAHTWGLCVLVRVGAQCWRRADIATINDIHSAYIHGSVPTAKGESDDIMDLNFPDEVRRGLLGVVSVWCACASGVRGRGGGRGRAR